MEKDPLSIAPGDRTFVITDSALKNIENMQRRVWDIENKYGRASEQYEKASFTFTQMLMTIFRWPGRVMAEDDLSLLIDSSITIGIIWHRNRSDEDGLLGEWSSHS